MTDRQTGKQNGVTIRLTVCERDAIKTKWAIIHRGEAKSALYYCLV